MTVNPGSTSIDGTVEWAKLTPDGAAAVRSAYLGTFRGPHGDAPQTDADSVDTGAVHRVAPEEAVPSALLAAHYRLGRQRPVGHTKVGIYDADDAGAFGPALQVVTEQAAMQMDSLTVLLHRLGVAYVSIMNPVFRVHRSPDGDLLDIRPVVDGADLENRSDGTLETWIHIQLSPSVDRRALAEAERQLPNVLADARQISLDSTAMNSELLSLADNFDTSSDGRFASPDRRDVAALLRWLADGHFVLLGYQRCPVRGGRSSVDESSRLGVLRLRDEVLPQLTDNNDLLVLAQATIPSYLRYGAYPYIVVAREHAGDGDAREAVEHRFVGLFTVAAMNANVLEIPLISRRVHDALALVERDPSHPGQLLLDIIQTVPRSELFALTAEQLQSMAMAVIDLGSRRRTLLFARPDQLGHFVSCLVYLPRDRYTTVVRLQMQDILVREYGGVSIDYSARVSESPWALVHFTVRMPDGTQRQDIDGSLANETRIQALLTEAARTWGDRLLGAVATNSIDQASAEHYASAFPEVYKQAVAPHRRHRRHRDHRRATR